MGYLTSDPSFARRVLKRLRGHAGAGRLRRRAWRQVRRFVRSLAYVAVWLALRLEVFAVIAAVAIATWAAWEGFGSVAGRSVLAFGLLFLGGGIGRIVREVRGG